MVGGLAHASKDFGKGKVVGSPELAPNVVGASHGPSGLARGNATPPNGALVTPDPEVKERKRRRYHTRGYKLSILKQAEELKGREGALGEFLRKEGLYTATLSMWRKQRNEGLLGQTRGRKPRSEEAIENEKLKKQIAKLQEERRQCLLVIEAQKKISEILGIRQDNVPPMPDLEDSE
jgi:transposase-like protein